MNYKRIYSEIILNRVNNPLPEDAYGQKHHVLPKSLYPQYKNTKANLVKLSAREHYICHLLLWKYYKNIDNKNAMYKMANAVSFFQRRLHVNNSHCYENIKTNVAEYISKINKGRKLTPEQCKNRSEMQKGEKHYNYGGHLTEEHKQKISIGLLKAFSDPEIKARHKASHNTLECKNKMSEAKKGFVPWNKGKKLSDEICLQISNSLKGNIPVNKGCKLTDEERQKVSEKTKDAMKRPEVYAKIKKRKVVCIETGIVYNSIKEACQMTKISSIGACCKRKIKHAGGYHWKYVDEVKNEEK